MDMILSGDANLPAMPMTEAEVNHLRRLLAWMRVEYTLDENMQRGYLEAANWCAEDAQGDMAALERVNQIVQEKADQINHVPAYVRQGVKMLTQAIRKHETKSGVVG